MNASVAASRTGIFALCASAVVVGTLLFAPLSVSAKGLIPEPTGKCPEDYMNPGVKTPLGTPCKNGGERDFQLDDIKGLLATIGNLMLSVAGAIVLFCFVLGGFFWIASAGNPKMVDRGKQLISGAVVGLIIMFTAYTLVIFAVRTIAGKSADEYLPKAVTPGANPTGGSSAGSSSTQNPSIKKGAISALPFVFDKAQLCTKLGGSCGAQNNCKTSFSIINACGGDAVSPASNECCLPTVQPSQTTSCGQAGGTCIDKSKNQCSGALVKGLCDAQGMGNSIECCFNLK